MFLLDGSQVLADTLEQQRRRFVAAKELPHLQMNADNNALPRQISDGS
jgi:Zn-dependent peptidase ImmA (M78 family)